MIKKLAELAKEENVTLDYCIGPANIMTIKVFAKSKDFMIVDQSLFSDDKIIEITKGLIAYLIDCKMP